MGFIGAPIAVAIIDNVLPVMLVLYVRFVAGSHCWPGLTKRGMPFFFGSSSASTLFLKHCWKNMH